MAHTTQKAPPQNSLTQAALTNGTSVLAVIFLLTLTTPLLMRAGSLLLFPYRVWLAILVIPLLLKLISGMAGRILMIDLAMIAATIWPMVSLSVNHPPGTMTETMGLHFVEFFGAYLLGRVAIRSAADFRRVMMVLFVIVMVLLPFAILESTTGRPVLLQLLPSTIKPSNTGERMGLRRVQSVFVHPIHFGAFASAVLGVTWFTLWPSGKIALRMAAAAGVALATFLSLSTGALIALVSQLAFIGWEMITRPARNRWRLFIVLSIIAYIAIDLLATKSPFHVLVNYASLGQGGASAYNRILIWDHGTKSVAAHPLYGIGMNDWVRPRWMGASVDNFWLLMTMRYGYPEIVALGLAMVLIVRQVSRAVLVDPADRAARAGYLVSLGGIALAGGTVHYWNSILSFVMFMIGSGVWIINGEIRKGAPPPPQPAGRRR